MNKYINDEDYLKAKGINLSLEIQDNDNKSEKVTRFIHEVTEWCIEYLVFHYDCNELLNFQALPEWRQNRFREGVIEQIEYVLNEGWLNKDSGLNRDLGSMTNLAMVELGRTAYQKFFLGAFCNIARG